MTRKEEIQKVARAKDKKDFIEAMLTWFKSPKVGNDEKIDRKFLSDAYDNISRPHWISVEDELPKNWEGEKQFVLYTEPYNEDYSYMGRLRIGEYDGDESKLYLIANNRWIIYGKNDGNTKVTHWMPLPTPPSCSEKPNNCKKGGEE